jgi:hypothetical protein
VAGGLGTTVAGGWVVAGRDVVGSVVASVGPLTKTVMDLVVDWPSLWNAVTVIVYDPIPAYVCEFGTAWSSITPSPQFQLIRLMVVPGVPGPTLPSTVTE